jgi:hypothetical protein
VADYDGDGRADLGVVRPGTGGSAPDAWSLLGTTSGYQFRNFVRSAVPLPAAYIR